MLAWAACAYSVCWVLAAGAGACVTRVRHKALIVHIVRSDRGHNIAAASAPMSLKVAEQVLEREKCCREGSKVTDQMESRECTPAAPGIAWCLEAEKPLALGLHFVGRHFVGLG